MSGTAARGELCQPHLDLNVSEEILTGASLVLQKAAAESRAATRDCRHVFYTALFGNVTEPLGPIPSDAAGCAIAFTSAPPSSFIEPPIPGWRYVEFQLPEMDGYQSRRLSRVPKLLPHLFFDEAVEASLYLDVKLWWPLATRLSDAINSTLDTCGASFAAMSHAGNPTNALRDAEMMIRLGHTANETVLRAQMEAYSSDAEFSIAEEAGRNPCIDGAMLVRSHRSGSRGAAARMLSDAWMRAYVRGSDRDQLPLSYVMRQVALSPCEQACATRAHSVYDAAAGCSDTAGCGVSCGTGFVHLMGHAETCVPDSVYPPLPAYASTPPSWVCSLRWSRPTGSHATALTDADIAAAKAAAAEAKATPEFDTPVG